MLKIPPTLKCNHVALSDRSQNCHPPCAPSSVCRVERNPSTSVLICSQHTNTIFFLRTMPAKPFFSSAVQRWIQKCSRNSHHCFGRHLAMHRQRLHKWPDAIKFRHARIQGEQTYSQQIFCWKQSFQHPNDWQLFPLICTKSWPNYQRSLCSRCMLAASDLTNTVVWTRFQTLNPNKYA